MKVMIYMGQDVLPTIAHEPDDVILRLARKLSGLELADLKQVREHLSTLPAPSGLYGGIASANAAVAAMNQPKSEYTGEQIKEARQELGMSAVRFGRELGYTGNNNTVNKQVYRLEKGERDLTPDRADRISALLAQHALETETA